MVAGSAALMRAVDPTLANGVVVNRIARTADPAGTQDQTGNGRVNIARALSDTSTDAIQPAGTAPVGSGGPFVGPYKAGATATSGDGTMSVNSTTVNASSTNTLTFTFTAVNDFGITSQVRLTIPTGWTPPQTAAGPGQVTAAATGGSSGCGTVGPLSVSGSDVTVTITCSNGKKFTLTYANATAPATATSSTFATATRSGGSGSPVAIASSPVVTVIGPPAQLAFTQQPSSSSTGGTAFGTQPKVTIQDSAGTAVTSDNSTQVTLAITSGTGTAAAALSCTTNPVTASAGVATFAGCKIDKVGTGYTLTATSGSLTSATSSGINITAGTVAKLAITDVNGGANPAAGVGFPVTVQSQDAGGNPTNVTGGTALGFSLSRTAGTGTLGGTLSGTIAIGANTVTVSGVTYSKAESGVVITATRTSGPAATAGSSAPFTVDIGPASKLAITSVNGGSNPTAGTPFSIVVQSQDVGGSASPVSADTDVSITLKTGTGTLGGTLNGTITAGSSQTTISGLTYTKAESGVVLTAKRTLTSDWAGDSAAFTVNAGIATKLAITSVNGGSNPTAGTAFSVTVRSEDANGNFSNVSAATGVSLTLKTGTGTLGGTLTGTIAASSSTLTISGVTYTRAESGVVLTATRTSGDTLAPGDSVAFTVNAGTITKLAITAISPATPTAGVGFSVTVQSQDANSNPSNVTGGTALGFSLSRTAGTGTLGGTLTGTIAIGANTVTVNGVTYTKAESGVVITATRTSGPAATAGASAPFTVNAGAASKLVIISVNGGVNPTAGSPFSIVVQSQDASGNAALVSTDTTMSITRKTGTGTLGGTLTGTILAGASATTISGLTYTKAESGVVLTATRTSGDTLTAGDSAAFTVNPGPAAMLVITSISPASPTAGTGFSVTVRSQDANGNFSNVSAPTAVSLTLKTGTGTLGGTLTGTIAAGSSTLTISGVTYTRAESGVVLTATRTSGDTLAPGDSVAFTVIAGAGSKLVFTTSPSDSLTNIAFSTQPTVTVQDAYGNTATSSTANITLSITTGTGTPGAALTCTQNPKAAVAGIDTFAGCRINLAGTGYQLHATASGLTAADSASFTINTGVPTPTSISPASVARGSADFTLTVNGTAFVNGSYVQFAGSPRVTAFVSATQLTATILASDVATLGSFAITAVNPAPGGGLSNAQTLTVTRGTTTSVSCTPGSAVQGASTTCTVTVSDASGASAFPPVGTVNFSTSGGGSFAPSSCTLSSSIGNSSTCSVTYNTSAGGSQTITAAYSGSTDDIPSSGTFTL
ncbi:MAG: hypothetical protein DMF98_20360, partial [Acidobacteria bacterium]